MDRPFQSLFVLSTLEHSLRCAGHRTVHFGGVPHRHSGHRVHSALEPPCAALAMPNLLRCLSASWRPFAGDHPNIGQRNRRTEMRHNR